MIESQEGEDNNGDPQDELEIERKEIRRLKVTDEEVLAEFSVFNEQIHKV